MYGTTAGERPDTALIDNTFSATTYLSLSVIFAFLLAIGVGVGIKFYLGKVSEPKFLFPSFGRCDNAFPINIKKKYFKNPSKKG